MQQFGSILDVEIIFNERGSKVEIISFLLVFFFFEQSKSVEHNLILFLLLLLLVFWCI
jgi:hypothetical protein